MIERYICATCAAILSFGRPTDAHRFGSLKPVQAWTLDYISYQCTAPSDASIVGAVAVTLSLNGVDYSQASPGGVFYYTGARSCVCALDVSGARIGGRRSA